MKARYLILVFCLFAFFHAPADVQANDPLKACFVVWAPYTKLVDGKPQGITVDIMREAAKRASFDLTLQSLPWKRCLSKVQRREFDFALDAVDRPGFIHGKHPNALYIQAFWIRASEDYGPFEYLGKLTGKRLGLMQGFQYSDEILNAGFSIIEWVKTENIAARMLFHNRLDLVYADAVVMQNVIQMEKLDLKPMYPVHQVQPLYASFNVGFTGKRDRMDQAIGSMHEDGTIDLIYTRHTGLGFSGFVEMAKRGGVTKLSN